MSENQKVLDILFSICKAYKEFPELQSQFNEILHENETLKKKCEKLEKKLKQFKELSERREDET